jgi:hypothetical protein
MHAVNTKEKKKTKMKIYQQMNRQNISRETLQKIKLGWPINI